MKHILLEKYLHPWIEILGRRYASICYCDGFAGRGEYTDGSLGSPIKALYVADGLATSYARMDFIFVEKDPDNFKNLEDVIAREKASIQNLSRMHIEVRNTEFANIISELSGLLREEKVPCFFFVDPFGFGGVPFEGIKTIFSIPRTEVLFTFMVSYLARFIDDPKLEGTFTTLYGTDQWRQAVPCQRRESALIELYRQQLHEAAAVEYSWHFRMCETDRMRTLYYLIHATNNFTGHKIMKDIMYTQSVDGSFAYLGPEDVSRRHQARLFDIHDIQELKDLLLERLAGKTLSFNNIRKYICTPWYCEPPYVDTHYRQALKELEKDGRISVLRVTSKTKRGLGSADRITFPSHNPTQMALPLVRAHRETAAPRPKLHYQEFSVLDGSKKTLLSKVGDGSIITRFDKTPPPKGRRDIVCPHFLELKWAYGCPFDCAWCYLKGTFRFRPEGTSPVVKPYEKTALHVDTFLSGVDTPEILNTGEIADSLMHETADVPFSRFIISLFDQQDCHRVLFLTKSTNVASLLQMQPHGQAVISFSLNAVPVAERWEKAPHILQRIEAAKSVFDAGYEVRVRIDPMVPIEHWREHYSELLRMIFDNFVPERITLGSLRGLQSTINGCTDKTWVRYLKESSNWGKKIDFETRFTMYSAVIEELGRNHDFDRVALCKETVQVWQAVGMDFKAMRCNCVA